MKHQNREFNTLIAFKDEDITKLVSTIILNKYNSHVDAAFNLNDFNWLLKKSDYDIILLDLSFADDIINLTEKLNINGEDNRIPTIIFTTYSLNERYNELLNKLDVFDLLIKPFNVIQLYAIIDYILYCKGYLKGRIARRYFRVNSSFITRLQVNTPHKESTEDTTSAVNVSSGGMCLRGKDDHQVDDKLDLDIIFKNTYGTNNISTKGVVKWIGKSPEATTFGVEFSGLANCDRVLLSHSIYS